MTFTTLSRLGWLKSEAEITTNDMILMNCLLLPEEFACCDYVYGLFNHEDIPGIFPAKHLEVKLVIRYLVIALMQPDNIHVSFKKCGCHPNATQAHDYEGTKLYTVIHCYFRSSICLKQ